MKVQTGISEKDRKAVAKGLSSLLADTYTLYLKTHNFHWNVTGRMFAALHAQFEQQYTELATAVDEIAERIRALGEHAPGSYADFGKLATVKEAKGWPKAEEMVKQLASDNETVVKTARKVFPVAEKANDEASLDLLAGRIRLHEKTAWMLRSIVE